MGLRINLNVVQIVKKMHKIMDTPMANDTCYELITVKKQLSVIL